MNILEKLHAIRTFDGSRLTPGLADDVIERFVHSDPGLSRAIEDAFAEHARLREQFPDIMAMDEEAQIAVIQEHIVNFYPEDGVNPYVTLAGAGPWIITSKGAVIHDSGGYGMIGLGHAPEAVLNAMGRHHVMANVMTANFSQLRITRLLEAEIGRTRGGCPYHRFVFLNSGSESVTMAARISDVNARLATEPGGKHAGKPIRRLSLRGGFHGRTDRPAQFSDSTAKTYTKHLASFREHNLLTVEADDLDGLRAVFARAEEEGFFIESMFMEPVMGEGNPGYGVSPEFYALARKLTRAHGSMLLVDSIQAGLRAHGCLSIVDYPGFENLEAPDMETYSKALNAGQYPLSVVAMNRTAAELYRKGIYGNTMTTNPRAMDVACVVLEQLTDAMRENIQARGKEFLDKLQALADDMNGAITGVQGTGLLFSCALDADIYKAYGADSTEEYMRRQGIGVIHGGERSLRFTPHFLITSAEVDLIVAALRDALVNGPRKDSELDEDIAVGI